MELLYRNINNSLAAKIPFQTIEWQQTCIKRLPRQLRKTQEYRTNSEHIAEILKMYKINFFFSSADHSSDSISLIDGKACVP